MSKTIITITALAYGLFIYHNTAVALREQMASVNAQCSTGEILCR